MQTLDPQPSSEEPTWQALARALSDTDVQIIEAALVEEMLGHPLKATSIDAAILLSQGRYFLQYRSQERSATAFQLRPLSPETLSAVFNADQHDSGWLPNNVMRCGRSVRGTWAVYVVNAALHPLEVVMDDRWHKLRVPLPTLLWLGQGQQYWLFALKSKFKPDAHLYRVPLPNVSVDGVVCFGSNTPPQAHPQTIAKAWELFITTPFNHHWGAGKSRAFQETVLHQLQQLHKTGVKRYPLNDLIPDDRRSTTVDRLVANLLLDPQTTEE